MKRKKCHSTARAHTKKRDLEEPVPYTFFLDKNWRRRWWLWWQKSVRISGRNELLTFYPLLSFSRSLSLSPRVWCSKLLFFYSNFKANSIIWYKNLRSVRTTLTRLHNRMMIPRTYTKTSKEIQKWALKRITMTSKGNNCNLKVVTWASNNCRKFLYFKQNEIHWINSTL